MTTLRELMDRARRHMDAAREQYADRPTSLYAAGSVGDQLRAVVRREPEAFVDVPPPRPREVEPPPPREREFNVPQLETNHVEDRPRRPMGSASPRQAARRESLRAMLRTPAALRRAIVVSEVLGPPVGLRDERR